MFRQALEWFGKHGYLQLGIILVLMTLMMPFLLSHLVLAVIFDLVFLDIMLVALSVDLRGRILKWGLVGLWLATLVLELAANQLHNSPLMTVGLSLDILFLCCSTTAILYHVFRSRQVTASVIFAAVDAYLLMAMIFGGVFSLLVFLDPQSMHFPLVVDRISFNQKFLDVHYFSLTTIASVGLGDVFPMSNFARSVTAVEGVLGQIYLTVLIAWLVGLHLAKRGVRPPRRRDEKIGAQALTAPRPRVSLSSGKKE